MSSDTINFEALRKGTVISGGGLAVYLDIYAESYSDPTGEEAYCLNLIGPDAGRVTRWGNLARVVGFIDAKELECYLGTGQLEGLSTRDDEEDS